MVVIISVICFIFFRRLIKSWHRSRRKNLNRPDQSSPIIKQLSSLNFSLPSEIESGESRPSKERENTFNELLEKIKQTLDTDLSEIEIQRIKTSLAKLNSIENSAFEAFFPLENEERVLYSCSCEIVQMSDPIGEKLFFPFENELIAFTAIFNIRNSSLSGKPGKLAVTTQRIFYSTADSSISVPFLEISQTCLSENCLQIFQVPNGDSHTFRCDTPEVVALLINTSYSDTLN
ncbi:MAG: hypothetical protein HQM10_07645 [Candidatus Riflebacteria bacterium]|nr:hypothetical protein [Candidatus Riflebacteria bacterium]